MLTSATLINRTLVTLYLDFSPLLPAHPLTYLLPSVPCMLFKSFNLQPIFDNLMEQQKIDILSTTQKHYCWAQAVGYR